jgi:hypothetical protein
MGKQVSKWKIKDIIISKKSKKLYENYMEQLWPTCTL